MRKARKALLTRYTLSACLAIHLIAYLFFLQMEDVAITGMFFMVPLHEALHDKILLRDILEKVY
jgi:hypothetical protein